MFRNFFACAVLSYKWLQSKGGIIQTDGTRQTKTVKRMNELLEGVVAFVNIAGDSWAANRQHFLSVVMVHRISSDFKNHLYIGKGGVLDHILRGLLSY